MPQITYGTPPGGGYRVDVPGAGGSTFGGSSSTGGVTGRGGGMDLSWITDFARKQAENKLAQQAIDRKRSQLDLKNAKTARARALYDKPRQKDPLEKALRAETITTEIAKQQAQRSAAPTRLVTGPQIIMGRTQDPLRMSAIQRQLFMPQAAGLDRENVFAPEVTVPQSPDNRVNEDWLRASRMYPGMTARMIGGLQPRSAG